MNQIKNNTISRSMNLLYIISFSLILLFLNNCQMDGCISPPNAVGGGNGVRISVPVYDTRYDINDNAKMWIDTGITVGPESRVPFFIDGVINLCAMDHSSSCNDAGCQEVKFYKRSNGNCFTVPSIQISTKDAIMLSPIFPLDFKVGEPNYTCSDIVKKNVAGVTFFDPALCELKHDNSSGKCLSESELINLCTNGAKSIYSTILEELIDFPPYLGMRYFAKIYNQLEGALNSTSGAENNILYKNEFNEQFISDAALIDMRNYGYDKIDCNKTTDANDPLYIKKFNSYDVNRNCANVEIAKGLDDTNIAYFFGGEFEDDGSDKFNPDTMGPAYFLSKTQLRLYIASDDTHDSAEYVFNANDLDLYAEIQLKNFNGIPQDKNVFGIFHMRTPFVSDAEYIGGYKFKIEKVCKRFYGKDLYIYIGGAPPDHKPGENTNTDLELDALEGKDINDMANEGEVISFRSFVINDNSSPEQIKGVNGTIYLGIKDLGQSETFNSKYILGGTDSSSNAYGVTFSIPTFTHVFSEKIVMPFIDFINNLLYGEDYNSGVIPKLFNAVFSRLRGVIQALIVMYITFFGYAYLFGLVQNSQKELLSRLIKISIIMAIFISGDKAWSFLGINMYLFFVKGVDYLFSLLEYSTLAIDSKFGFIDRTLGPFLDGNTWTRLLSLFFTGPIGWLVLAAIIWGIVQFMSVCLEVVMRYFMMMIAMGWLLSLTPLFLMFKLFNATKEMFESWLKLIISFSLQPLFLIVSVAFLNEILFWSMNQLINFSSCGGGCAIFMNIGESNPEDPFGFCLIRSNLPAEYANDIGISNRLLNVNDSPESKFMGLPFGIMPLFMFIIMTNLMRIFATDVADNIVQGITGTMGSIQSAARQGSEAVRSIIGKDAETKNTLRNALAQRTDQDSLDIKAKGDSGDASRITRKHLPSSHWDGMKSIARSAKSGIKNKIGATRKNDFEKEREAPETTPVDPPTTTDRDTPEGTPVDPPTTTDRDTPEGTPVDPPTTTDRDTPEGTPVDPPTTTDRDTPEGTPVDPPTTTDRDTPEGTPVDPQAHIENQDD